MGCCSFCNDHLRVVTSVRRRAAFRTRAHDSPDALAGALAHYKLAQLQQQQQQQQHTQSNNNNTDDVLLLPKRLPHARLQQQATANAKTVRTHLG